MLPVGKRVLVRESEAKEATDSGIIFAPNAQKEMIVEGVVVEVPDVLEKDYETPVNKGDKVLYNRNYGVPVTAETGEQLFVVEVERVLAKFSVS